MIKKKKSYSSALVFIVMGFVIVALVFSIITRRIPDKEIYSALSTGLIWMVGVYLGIDFASVVKGTLKLPSGQFRVADAPKYLAMILGVLVCTLLMAICWQVTGANIKGDVVKLIYGTMGLASIYVGGMKVNKLSTGALVPVEEESI